MLALPNRSKRACLVTGALIAAIGAPLTVGATTASAAIPSTIRMVSGNASVKDATGAVWQSDKAFARGGRLSTTTHAIVGTDSPALFRTERYGATGYQVPVASGNYTVTLNMAEHYWNASKKRVFDVSAEGRVVASRLDLVAKVGEFHAYELTFGIRVTDGVLSLGFVRHTDWSTVSSIIITPAVTPAPPTSPVTTSSPVAAPPATIPPVATTPPVAAIPPAAQPTSVVTPESFGARGDGVTDDTAALQRAFDSAPAGTPVLLSPGKIYAHSDLLYLRRNGLHVTGSGVLLATNEARSSVWIQADDVLVDGGVDIKTAHTTTRWSAWEQMGLRLQGHARTTLRDITVEGSAAAGIYIGDSATRFVLDHVTVQNTRADGIHMTMGSNNGQVIAPTVVDSGDDGVAVVSYTADGAACHDISVTAPRVLGTTWGRGLSVVGGTRITETGIDVEQSSAAAVYIAAEGSPWFTAAPTDVTISGGTISGANTSTTVDHGAVVVLSGETGPTPSQVTVTGLDISNTRATASRDIGVITYGSAPSAITFSDLTIHGGPSSAYSGNTVGSSYRTVGLVKNGVRLPDHG